MSMIVGYTVTICVIPGSGFKVELETRFAAQAQTP